MMDNDDKLLKQFFSEHKQEIADNGFSRRVMHHLPNRQIQLARWWSLCCFVVGLLWFTLNNGWVLLKGTLQGIWADIITSSPEIEAQTILVLVVFVVILGYRKILSLV